MKEKPILETTRLILRKWTIADHDILYEILGDLEVARHIGDGKPFTLERAKQFLSWAEIYERKNGFCRWKVIEKASSEIIGSCGFARMEESSEIELGYLFAQKHWGKGYATEVAEAAMNYGFNKLGFRGIIALTDLEHIASQRVLEKIGFEKRGVENFRSDKSLVFVKNNPNE